MLGRCEDRGPIAAIAGLDLCMGRLGLGAVVAARRRLAHPCLAVLAVLSAILRLVVAGSLCEFRLCWVGGFNQAFSGLVSCDS